MKDSEGTVPLQLERIGCQRTLFANSEYKPLQFRTQASAISGAVESV